jgi:DNA invertase Pin-like site-specific DNA recombinase
MANDEHVALLKQGVAACNAWRDKNPDIRPDLSGADLYSRRWRRRSATRTKAALAAAKARGVKLGGPKLAEARKAAVERNVANADQHAANVLRDTALGRFALHQIADALNARGISTPRGGRWYAKSVSNVLARSA